MARTASARIVWATGGARRSGGPKRGGPKGGGPKGGGPKGGGPKFRTFFPLPFFAGFFSWNFGGVESARTLKSARLEFSGCRVKPGGSKAAGTPAFKNTTKIPGQDPKRGTKE